MKDLQKEFFLQINLKNEKMKSLEDHNHNNYKFNRNKLLRKNISPIRKNVS